MASFPLQIKASGLVLIGLIKIEGTGAVCGFLSPYRNLLRCLKHMVKGKISHQKKVLGNKAFPHSNLFFLGVIYLEDYIGKIAYFTLTTNILFSKHMFGLMLMSGEVILPPMAFCSETYFE